MKYGNIGLIGATNAGKSSLFNLMCNANMSAVSHKINTTSTYVQSTVTFKDGNAVIFDTPGTFDLTIKSMFDFAILVHDATKKIPEFEPFCKTILCINKVDKIKNKEELLAIIDKFNNMCQFEKIFLVSVYKNNGVNDLMDYVYSSLPSYPTEFEVTQKYNSQDMVFNILKEIIFKHMHDEIPYNVKVSSIIYEKGINKVSIVSNKKRYKKIFHKKFLEFLEYKVNHLIKARFNIESDIKIKFVYNMHAIM